MPWAGYWYPYNRDTLYNGDDSPLRKLDAVAKAEGRDTTIGDEEAARADPTATDSWEGRCYAWAVAATRFPEPKHDAVIDDVTFTVADQKALLTDSHEAALVNSKTYGIRFDGTAATADTQQDMRPEAFQRLFMTMLGDHKKPFIIDKDPNVEVWSTPIYRVRYTITKDPSRANAVHVLATALAVQWRGSETNDLTSPSDSLQLRYEYRLYVDPQQRQGDKFRVIAGEWLGDSLDAHPDMVMVPTDAADWSSLNDQFNANVDLVKKIVELGQADQ
jgi:hypothetical protein